MTHSTPPAPNSFPHHKLIAYQLALSLVKLVARTRIADAQLRQQARRSAASAALNSAEGAARQTLADKSRAYAIFAGGVLRVLRGRRNCRGARSLLGG